MNGEEFVVQVMPQQRVFQLKNILEPKVGVPPSYQQLALDADSWEMLYSDEGLAHDLILNDQHSLKESGVTDGAQLSLVLLTVPSSLPSDLCDLVLPDKEVGAHARILAQMKWHTATARAVADYLYENRVLLTGVQAARIFHVLVDKIVNKSSKRGLNSARAELVMALHSFVLDQRCIWEKDDGLAGCLWANISSNCRDSRVGGTDPCNFCSLKGSRDKSFAEVNFITAFSNICWRGF